MNENLVSAEQELYLAPEEEKIENAEEIAQLSLEVEKHPFIIQYDPIEKETIISELEKIGCAVSKQLDFANCVAVSMSMSQLRAVKSLACVEAVERDFDYKILSNSMSEKEYVAYWAGENLKTNVRKEVRIAVFDTGTINSAVTFAEDAAETDDSNGHGTQMINIISSVIADKENRTAVPVIYPVAVANHRGFTKTSTIMQAIDWAINKEVKIISMSFGDYRKSNLLEEMINRAASCGIVMVAAAGNDGGFKDENRIMYPAAFDNVLSVGAKNGEAVAPYSNGGSEVDCLACGTQNTTDVNGNAISVIGTSAATAFVAGTILKNWCICPTSSADEIVSNIKAEMTLTSQIEESAEVLTVSEENDIIADENNLEISDLSTVMIDDANVASANDGISLLCVGGNCDSGCSSNNMSTAINLPYLSWQHNIIRCPGSEVWYKFTANASNAHPGGGVGWYTIRTRGSLDTVGFLYDAYGNQIAYNDDSDEGMNFEIRAQLYYGETYFICVRAFGSNTGNFGIWLSYFSDDHGDTPRTATEIIGVYYEDQSISGSLHSNHDVDYYSFVPARNCVMEIYTEGNTNTYGELYCASGGLLDSDNNSNGNGNFKITAHLEAMKKYYIAVSHNSSTGYGNYTLRFKFVKNWMYAVTGQYNIVLWKNTDTPNATSSDYVEISRVFVTSDAASEYYAVIVEDLPSYKPSIGNAIESGIRSELWSALRDCIIDALIPDYADFLSLSLNVGQVIYDNMKPSEAEKEVYKSTWNLVRDSETYGETYIIGKTSQKKTLFGNYSNKLEYIAHGPIDVFYGADYQRGNFSIATLK